MSKKKTRRIYLHEDGRWRLETTYTTGRTEASIHDTKESAERLLDLSEKYSGHFVKCTYRGEPVTAKVTNTAICHHKDGTFSEMLYVRMAGHTYLKYASDCILIN